MPGSLRGRVDRVTYHNEENLYTVLRLRDQEGLQQTVVGYFAPLTAGEEVSFEGEWVQHPEYGRQFRAEVCEIIRPATVEGIEKYLASGLIKGVGPVTARRIVEHFGAAALDVITKEPDRLTEVPGIGLSKAGKLAEALKDQAGIRDVMIFLQSHGISPGLAAKIYKSYGEESIDKVNANPYMLAEEVFGIGFKTADRIARSLGIGTDSPSRIQAGLGHILREYAQEGHMFVPMAVLTAETAKILGVEAEAASAAIRAGAEAGQLVIDQLLYQGSDDTGDEADSAAVPGSGSGWEGLAEATAGSEAVYLAAYYHAECSVAQRLVALATFPALTLPLRAPEEADTSGRNVVRLTADQLLAVESAQRENVLVITGGPGTGKTTTLNSIIRYLEAAGLGVALAAPTGRAAKRMTEATGREAKTVHRLLEYAFVEGAGMRFQRDEARPLDADVVIVDEVSMVDSLLMYTLLRAIRLGTRLVLVGDVDQLPSVGPGNVLKDILQSGVIPAVRLSEIFRQGEASHIVVNAHRINRGLLPHLNDKDKDFFLLEEDDPDRAADLVVELVKERLPEHVKCDSFEDIQVLTPMRRMAVGVENLNKLLQAALNPPGPLKPEIEAGGTLFRCGDKVMQIRNNYQKGVFNGDIGRIGLVDLEEGVVMVVYGGVDGDREVLYERAELDELVLSYAVTVHKSQGSEYPVVVLPLLTQHYVMLQRNLFYTAVTRARRFVVLVGSRRAVAIAVRNNRIQHRYTGLSSRLRGYLPR